MKTRHRIMPRSFGRYELGGEIFTAVESEEICIETNSLTFDEYIHCRELNLTVEIVHNGGMFAELKGLCKWLGHSWFDFLLRFHSKCRSFDRALADMYDTFRVETMARLWTNREELEEYVKQNIEVLLKDENSTNEMSNAKVAAFFHLQDTLYDILFGEMEGILKEKGCFDSTLRLYLQELKDYSRFKKKDIIDYAKQFSGVFHFDFIAIEECKYGVDPRAYRVDKPLEYHFYHTVEQKELIAGYVNQYGKTLDGLGRILMRARPTRRLFRNVSAKNDPLWP